MKKCQMKNFSKNMKNIKRIYNMKHIKLFEKFKKDKDEEIGPFSHWKEDKNAGYKC